MKTSKIAPLFLSLLLVSVPVPAKTPDGETPAQESVCDNLKGAARGLCNAYCEALDCDSDAAKASSTACTKVRTAFEKVTGNPPPCLAASCPCNLSLELWTDPGWLFITLNTPSCEIIEGGKRLFASTLFDDPAFDDIAGVLITASDSIDPRGNIDRRCEVRVPPELGTRNTTRAYETAEFGLSPEEVEACVNDIERIAEAYGLTCQ